MKVLVILLLVAVYCKGQPGKCSIDGSSATLPACMSKYFKNGLLIDGNSNKCDSTKGIIPAKLTVASLLAKGEAAVKSTSACQGEHGNGNRPGQGRKKRQSKPTCVIFEQPSI